jgi:ABC-type glycerol-3-phosphate transport system substrate-binding protein
MNTHKFFLAGFLCLALASFLFASGSQETTKQKAGEEPINIVFLTHKENEEVTFARYQKEFQEKHPNVTITYEPIHDYKSNIEIRWTSGNWGDMCMIPHQFLNESELPNLFAPLGSVDEFAKKYEFASTFSFEGEVYGITSTGTAYGVLWNKAVLQKAGVTSFPKTPEEFYDALRKVKANTDAIPLYVDYGAGSRLADWEWNARGSLTADPDYKNKLVYMDKPFSKGKPYYTVMEMLYTVVKMNLVEDDPSTSTWDSCKNLLAQGKVACTVIGSWAADGTKDASDTPDDIVFTAFPWNIEGKQYATIAADYAYAINKDIDPSKLEICKDYIRYLTEESNFSYDYGGIPITKG